MSFTVKREIRHIGYPPHTVAVLSDYHPANILEAVDIARALAFEHASNIAVDKPIPTHGGYMFWSNSGSVVTYRAEEI